MSRFLTANRLAAIAGFCGSLGTAVAALAGALPTGSGAAKAAVTVAGVLGQVATIVMYLRGSQKWDELTAGSAAVDRALTTAHPGDFTGVGDGGGGAPGAFGNVFVAPPSTEPANPHEERLVGARLVTGEEAFDADAEGERPQPADEKASP